MSFPQSGDPIIIRRSDVEQLLAFPKHPRDQLIVDLPARMGFRAGEIVSLRRDFVDVEKGCVYVLDSKKRKRYPVPMPYDVAKLVEQCSHPDYPLVVRRLPHTRGCRTDLAKPLTIEEVYQVTKRLAVRAGLLNWHDVNTTLLRHFFAANCAYNADPEQRLSLETIRRIMRHKSLAYTQIYLSRLVFFEDIKADVDRLHRIPNVEEKKLETELSLKASSFYEQWCSKCAHEGVCRFLPDACNASEWTSGCKKFWPKLNVEASGNV